MTGQRIDGEHVLTDRRGSEIALLTAEVTLRSRRPDAVQAAGDLREWVALHAEVAPGLAARLPQVNMLLRARPGPPAQGEVAGRRAGAAPCNGIDVLCTVAQAAERLGATESGIRWLLARGRLHGAKSPAGRWRIDGRSVTSYSARRAMRRT